MQTKILAFSGRKGAGKDTCANFILGLHMVDSGLIDRFQIDSQSGRLMIPVNIDGQVTWGLLDYDNPTPAFHDWRVNVLDHRIKLYSFADKLKQNICVDILGLRHEQVYGTDEQKNTPTEYRWKDINERILTEVGFVLTKPTKTTKTEDDNYAEQLKAYEESQARLNKFLTARDCMEVVGTNCMRRFYHSVWAKSTLRWILRESPENAIIRDLRFPDEFDSTEQAGGKVVRLTRFMETPGKSRHESDYAMDKDRFDWSRFYKVIDNEKMYLNDQFEAIYKLATELGMTP